ncbi:hypothetical protein [Nibricoccus aquaticus]|nr:hypothetical protein [Nibricoccus aquaticus]
MKTKLLLCLVALVFTATANAAFYLFSDLGAPASYPWVIPTGINNAGQIVGSAYDLGGHPVAFRLASGTFYTHPSPGPAHSSWGNAINSTGIIAGLCDRNGSIYHACYVTPGGGLAVDFDSDFTRNSEAVSINDSNYVVGTASSQPFIGHTSGWIFLLGSTIGGNFVPKDMNNDFVMAGYDTTWGGKTYDVGSGTTTYLGWALGSFSNRAYAINERGEVAGTVGSQGFLYSGGVAVKFGSSVTEVKAVNTDGDVVGTASGKAFVYLRDTAQFIDLNTAISAATAATWTLLSADGINDGGVIVGRARRLATPADDPGAGMYIYRGYRLRPFVFIPLPLTITP